MALPRSVIAGPLVLRPWVADDVDDLAKAVADTVEQLRPWMQWAAAEPLARRDRAKLLVEFASRWETGEDFVYGIFLDGLPVGGTGLHPRVADGLEIGYWVRSGYTGRGFATAASRALTDVAFTAAGAGCVEIHHDKANLASGRVPAKLGFECVAEVPDGPTAPGEVGIECQWRMTRRRWAAGASARLGTVTIDAGDDDRPR